MAAVLPTPRDAMPHVPLVSNVMPSQGHRVQRKRQVRNPVRECRESCAPDHSRTHAMPPRSSRRQTTPSQRPEPSYGNHTSPPTNPNRSPCSKAAGPMSPESSGMHDRGASPCEPQPSTSWRNLPEWDDEAFYDTTEPYSHIDDMLAGVCGNAQAAGNPSGLESDFFNARDVYDDELEGPTAYQALPEPEPSTQPDITQAASGKKERESGKISLLKRANMLIKKLRKGSEKDVGEHAEKDVGEHAEKDVGEPAEEDIDEHAEGTLQDIFGVYDNLGVDL